MLDRFASVPMLVGAAVLVTSGIACSFSDQLDAFPTLTTGADAGTHQGCGPNGNERCAEPGDACESDMACAGRCVDAKCAQPTHSDGKKNLGETDVDCGGASAPECTAGQACSLDTDCAGRCDGNVCAAPSATDGKKNRDETDIDCGGSAAPTCNPGQICGLDADCAGLCTMGLCSQPTHTDGKKNLDETDIDCGGASADSCSVGMLCAEHADCNLRYCAAGSCAAPLVDDTLKNGLETDVDCGGATQVEGALSITPERCALTKRCLLDADCGSEVCSDSNVCVEAPSCRPLSGGSTCGTGETGDVNAAHESCCKTLPVEGMTLTHLGIAKQVYIDKYEITAGRVREWVRAIRAQYAGVGNVRAWVTARMAIDPLTATQISAYTAYLPSAEDGESYPFPASGGGTTPVDIGMKNQLGPTSFYRGEGLGAPGATSGCAMYAGAFGHRTYWYDDAERAYFGEIARPASSKDQLDEKSMNCLTPAMYAAFCAWDGGYLPTRAAAQAAYGPDAYPWGSQEPRTDPLKRGNVNDGVGGFGASKAPRYLFPIVDYATFADDFSPVIAAPGRFPLDVSPARPAADSWMDFGGNMIEIIHDGTAFKGYAGGSWEGHQYARALDIAVVPYDKYGKTSTRCMRLR